MTLEDLPHTARDGTVPCEIRSDENSLGTHAFGAHGRHGGANAELPGLVGSGADDRTIAPPGNNHGLAAQLRIVALLNRSVKGVHVDMDDFPHDSPAPILSASETR